MTNICRKMGLKKRGAAVLFITILLLFSSLSYFAFVGSGNTLKIKASNNQNTASQAQNAARAGIQYAIPYLSKNSSRILANPVSGFIPNYSDSNTSNVVLPDGSKYTITYSNPTANNYLQIKISVLGVSADGASTHTISVLTTSKKTTTISVAGNVKMDKHGNTNSFITNTITNMNVITKGTMSMTGNCATITSTGITSNSSSIGSDVTQNATGFPVNEDALFTSTFNTSKAVKKSQMAIYYNNTPANSNYTNLLNGLSGTTIWIDDNRSSVKFNGTLGTPAAPVLLIVMDNLGFDMASAGKIYGVVYVSGGPITLFANALITGQLISYGSSLYLNGSSITYKNYPGVASLPASTNYNPVPGSWKDF